MPKRSVVLIDEIDKAPLDVPNDILVELERLEFEIPELRTVRKPAADNSRQQTDNIIGLDPHENRYRPIVIITSNSEKALPDPFLRRCVYHHLEFPPFRLTEGEQSEEIVTVEDIVASRLGSRYADGGQHLVAQGISLFRHLREESGRLQRRPTLAELLDWLNYLLPRPGEGKPKASMILERAVGRGGVYGCGGAGQGATTPNSQSIQGGATPPCAATAVQSAP